MCSDTSCELGCNNPLPQGYSLTEGIITVDSYLRLREDSGLSTRTRNAAVAGLPHSLHMLSISYDGAIVGMGRIIGDRGLVFHLVDIAVHPAHQGRGLGKAIIQKLLQYIRRTAPAEAYVSLMAKGKAHNLYSSAGFSFVAPVAQGMEQWL